MSVEFVDRVPRLMECVRLRVTDLDFVYHQIIVRNGKGVQDRMTMLPQSIHKPLQHHLYSRDPDQSPQVVLTTSRSIDPSSALGKASVNSTHLGRLKRAMRLPT